jgi:hypothetical protein
MRTRERIRSVHCGRHLFSFIGSVLFITTLTFSQGPTSKPFLTHTPRCHEIDNWIKSHPSHLPTDLEELSLFPVRWRARLLGALRPEVQMRIWQRHLDNILREADLSADQRLGIEESLDLISTPLFYTPNRSLEVVQRARVLETGAPCDAPEYFGLCDPYVPGIITRLRDYQTIPVRDTWPGGPAEKAGVCPGDIVLAVTRSEIFWLTSTAATSGL